MNVRAERLREGQAANGRDAPGQDSRAFTEWMAPHWVALHRVAARLCGTGDADDVVQEALGIAWRKRAQFDPQRGTARAWLVAITVDQSRKHRRRRDLARAVVLVDEVDSVGTGNCASDGSDTATSQVVGVDVWRAVGQISERQRLAVALFYYVDLSIDEVAVVMGCSEGTVKSTLFDARRRLAAVLGDGYR